MQQRLKRRRKNEMRSERRRRRRRENGVEDSEIWGLGDGGGRISSAGRVYQIQADEI